MRPGRPLLAGAVLAAAILAAPKGAFAHAVPFSYLDLRLEKGVLSGELVAHIADVGHELGLEPADRLLDPAVAGEHSGEIGSLIAMRMAIAVDGQLVTPHWSSMEPIADRQAVRLRFEHPVTSLPGVISVRALLFPYDPNHRTFLNLYEGGELTQAILDREHPAFEYFAGTRQGRLAVVRRFLPAGVEHILVGPDHLLFLAGLLLLGGTLRRLALIVTGFTIAHTITLSLAALNLVTPPARIIEPAIALSIVFVGADNLLRGEGRDLRAWIAFGFGFIHGFGFAYVLREMGLPARALGWSLFSFNLGVEIGQLAAVVVFASLLAAVRRRSPVAGGYVARVGSALVVAAGVFWYIQRVFFPGGS